MRIVIFLIFIFVSPISLYAQTLTVITKQNAIRESCRFFSPIKETVVYNDVLEVTSQQGEWYLVKFNGIQGCIHKSAVEKKSVSLTNLGSSGGQSASGDEVALAGKGFNPQVESEYKSENPSLNFNAVDEVEKYKVTETKLLNFIQKGKLNP